MTNGEMRTLIMDVTADKCYNACLPEELYMLVRGEIPDERIDDEDSVSSLFFKTLEKMCNEKELGRSGRGNIVSGAQLGYLHGTFRANARGYGFLIPDPRFSSLYPEDLFVPAEQTGGAMNGDAVFVRVERHTGGKSTKADKKKKDRRSTEREHPGQMRTVCAVIRIVSRSVTHVTGTLYKELPRFKKGTPRYFIEADNDRITAKVHIRPCDLNSAQPGDRVEVEIIKYPKPDYPSAQGRVTHVFGDTESKEANYAVILRENRIPTEFPQAVLDAAAHAAARPVTENARLDLRGSVIFTIDSEDAKDLDDAISLEKTQEGWLLGVHIADVAEYVHQNSAVDTEAYARGTSVYFVDSVVPMLPKVLSNGVCSLNGGEDRYALSALISLDHNGTIVGCECRETIIRSCVRGVYSELNDILANGEKSQYYEKYRMLFPHVYPQMVQLYEILDSKNRARGALELETAEPRFILDKNGYPCDIVRRERGISECLIEQFMLCANEAVALWLSSMQMPCIYRIHEEPSPEKLQAFITFAHNLGLNVRPLKRRQLRPSDLQSVMNEARECNLEGVLSTVMLRSLSKARYSCVQSPHFGLATDCYCHFTSPIRRYPDLCVHRFVKAILHGELDIHSTQKAEAFAEKAAQQSTECEIRAMTAERSIEDLYKVLYLEDKIGVEFEGTVSSVTSFGFFVELDNTCEGLVPISDLDGFYTYDEKNLTLTCGTKQYRLGQRVRICIEHADRISRRVDMSVVEKSVSYGRGGRQ